MIQLIGSITIGSALLVGAFYSYTCMDGELNSLRRELASYKEADNVIEPLSTYIDALINDRAPNIPSYKKHLIASTLERVTKEIFTDRKEQEAYITLVAIESGFNPEAKSSAGAIGLSQLMPQYVTEFAEQCNIKDFRIEDLRHIELQLRIGACTFRQLLKVTNGNTSAALVGYNAGINSASFQALVKGKSIQNTEAANYVTKHKYLTDKVRGAIK